MKTHKAACLMALLASLCASPAQAEHTLSFLVMEQGVHSGISTQRFETIRDPASLQALWKFHRAGLPTAPAVPEVDFSKEMLIAAFAGQKSSGGYQLNITGLERRGKQTEVSLSLTQPGPDCIVAEALTQPYVIAKLSKTKGPVSFKLSRKTFSCVTGNPL